MATWTTAARTIRDPYYGVTRTYRIVQPVCDDANYLSQLGWRLLGIVGDYSHWNKKAAGDHTSRSTHVGRRGYPKEGWVYAIDVGMPSSKMSWVEKRVLELARSGQLPQLKYFNILNRHWNWQNGFRTPTYSADHHLHLSYEPGFETATGRSILRAIHSNSVSSPSDSLFEDLDING